MSCDGIELGHLDKCCWIFHDPDMFICHQIRCHAIRAAFEQSGERAAAVCKTACKTFQILEYTPAGGSPALSVLPSSVQVGLDN